MAISKQAYAFGLLDTWRELVYENPYHFNQAIGAGAPLTGNGAGCTVYIQDNREPIARALIRARSNVETYLRYPVMPTWYTEDIRLRAGVPYELQRLALSRGKFIQFGKRAMSLIQAGVTVTYSDIDNDLINDLATITVATSVTDTAEVAVYFTSADGGLRYVAQDDRWRIEPLTVSIAGGTATITGHRSLFVKPNTIWDRPYKPTDPNHLEINSANTDNNSGDFVTTVDIYRVYNDSSAYAYLLSDPFLFQTTSWDTLQADGAIAQIVDSELGIFRIRPNPPCSGCCPHEQEIVRVYYQAGLPLQNGHIDYEVGEAIIRLANCLHPETLPCALCDGARRVWERDRCPVPPENLSADIVGNPFGLNWGQLEAWKIVNDMAVIRSGKLA